MRVSESYPSDVANHGFAVVENVVDPETISSLLQALAKIRLDGASERAGKAFEIRNLLNVVPVARELAQSSACQSLVEPILGNSARVIRGVYCDKHRDANWKVAWHQERRLRP